MPDKVTVYRIENLTLSDHAVLCRLLNGIITITNISWTLSRCQISWQHFTLCCSLNLLRGRNHNSHLIDEEIEDEMVTAWPRAYRKGGCEPRSFWLQSPSSYLWERATTDFLTKYQRMIQNSLLCRLRSEVAWLGPGGGGLHIEGGEVGRADLPLVQRRHWGDSSEGTARVGPGWGSSPSTQPGGPKRRLQASLMWLEDAHMVTGSDAPWGSFTILLAGFCLC